MRALILSTLVTATLGTPSSSNTQSGNGSNPCAQLSSQAAQRSTFQPSLALDCFRDVPMKQSRSVDLIDWIQRFVQFQTTLAWLKNPPPSYPRRPVDIVQGLDDISDRAANGTYTSEFDFEVDILATVYSAADLHFSYQPYFPATLSGGASVRGVPLVSVSSDGHELPQIYVMSDIESTVHGASFTPSAVTAIDGKDPETLIDHIGKYNPTFTDLDAEYNAFFVNPVPLVFDTLGLFNQGFDPTLPDDTTYSFANGSQITVENTISLPPFPGTFSSGEDLYTALLLEPPSTASASSATSLSSSPASASSAATSKTLGSPYPGYPTPVVAQAVPPADLAISGYFLPQSDVAVLSITSMDFYGEDLDPEFQKVSEKFLSMCKSSGKTSLIIDLRRNLGGNSAPAFDLFKRLFPNVVPFSSIRTRATAATNALGLLTSELQDGFPPHTNASTRELLASFNTTFFNYHTDLKSPDGPSFDSWAELYGPGASHGDNFTNTAAELLSDPSYTEVQYDMIIAGYANLSHVPTSPFSADQITILSDGLCSSACATFARLMVDQGVRTISVGGRPSKDSMALIGGTQGNAEWPFSGSEGIAEFAQLAIDLAQATNSSVDVSALEPLTRKIPIQANSFSMISVNLFDNLGKDDESLVPLQFTRWLAGCRMFYTARDMVDVQHTWQRVAQGVSSGGQGLCVQGSLAATKGGVSTPNSAGMLQVGSLMTALLAVVVYLFVL